MVSTAANRAVFISSLIDLMKGYSFDGIDLDREYPAADSRGGRPDDTANLVSLVKEMRIAFGSKGISMTLAPDYWYLRGFDPIAMQESVDFFGFMSYDLHGSWDADVKTLGSIIRPQTDIRDIDQDLLPLWFDGLDPKKVNFGLAYYGRGYTVTDPACSNIGCGFSGPSRPGPCTAFPGILSLREIESIINKTNVQPRLIPNAMVKQLSYDTDQWIGYDDEETFALKIQYADSACLGGTMIWSIDFASGAGSGDTPDGGPAATTSANNTTSLGDYQGPVVYSSDGSCGIHNGNTFCSANADTYNGTCCSPYGYCGSGENYCGTGCTSGCDGNQVTQDGSSAATVGDDVYIDPSIWTTSPTDVSCNSPCQLILPPFPLDVPSTIVVPSLTATWTITQTLESVGIKNGATITTDSVTKFTTMADIYQAPLLASSINVSAIIISAGQSIPSMLTPQASLTPTPITITYSVTPIDNSGPTSTSSSAAAAVVFGGKAPGGLRTRTFYPPPITLHTPPPFPKPMWKPGPPGPLCPLLCHHPPPGGEDNSGNGGEDENGRCSGDDCDPKNNIENGKCQGEGCPISDNPSSNDDGKSGADPPADNNDDDDDDDDDDNELCMLQPQVKSEADPRLPRLLLLRASRVLSLRLSHLLALRVLHLLALRVSRIRLLHLHQLTPPAHAPFT